MNWGHQGAGGPGQWNIGVAQPTMAMVGSQPDANQIDLPPVWDNMNQVVEADFGSSWDATLK